MEPLRYFLDTHDVANGTFPAGLTPEQFKDFYKGYKAACFEEGVVPITVHLGYEEGRAFCLTMAPNAEAVERAHKRAGLPFHEITEVKLAKVGDTFSCC